MKKYIIITLSILLIIVLSIPLVIGILYKSQYNTLIASIGASTNGQVQSKVLDYQLGWLHSTVHTETTITGFNNTDKLVFDETERVSHGPFVYDPIKKRFSTNFTAATGQGTVFLVTQNGGKTPLTTLIENSVMHFDKTILSSFNMGNVNINTLQWNGVKGSYKGKLHQGALKHESFTLTSGALSLSDPKAADSSAPVAMQIDSASINCAASLAQATTCTFMLPRSTIKFNDQSSMTINGLSVKHNATVKENNYSSLFALTINKIDAPQFTIPNINTIRFNITTSNLSLAAITKKAVRIDALYNVPMQVDFITPATTLNAAFTAQSTFGNLNVSAASNWKALPKNTVANIDELQKSSHIDATLQISIPLAKKIVELIVPLIPETEMTALREKAGIRQLENADRPENKDLFDKEVALLVQSNQLDLPSAISIMNAQEGHMADDDFRTLINALPLSDENKAKLLAANEKTKHLTATEQPISSMEEKVMLVINDWLARAYLVQKDNDYVAAAVVDAGKMQLNGRPFQ